MPFRWLEEDDDHPIRPDLPLFRHLTFTEVHSLELGAYIGLLALFAVRLGLEAQILTILFAIVRFVISDGKAKAGATRANHPIGFHDVRQEPPYFGAGFLIAFGLAAVGLRVWTAFGLGTIA